MLEVKKLRGVYNYNEAKEKGTEGWRLPTVFELFELMKMAKKDTSISSLQWCWSATPYAGLAIRAWVVCYVRLVRGGENFEFSHSVCQKEVDAFIQCGKLPLWHPPIKIKK